MTGYLHDSEHADDPSVGTPCPHNPTTVITAQGETAEVGDRVWNYYDLRWGTIIGPVDRDGWFTFEPEDGTQRQTLNGERITRTEVRPR